MKIENEFAIIEQTPGSITITWKHPNTEKPKVKAHDITTLDNAGLFIKPSDQISYAKLMIDGKPLAEVINDLRAAIASVRGDLAVLQASQTASQALKTASQATDALQRTADDKDVYPYHFKDSDDDHDEHK